MGKIVHKMRMKYIAHLEKDQIRCTNCGQQHGDAVAMQQGRVLLCAGCIENAADLCALK